MTTDRGVLEPAQAATFATEGRVLAMIRPGTREEVRQALAIASAERVPVHPVSGGKNWGLGSRAPLGEAVLLDLGRLNRIVELSEDLAYARIEPGVTFRQLYDHLRQHRSKLFVSTIGGSPESSVLANALERGDGSGPLGERALHLAALEVVLPSGELVHTGFGRFGESGLAPLHRFGVGPALDGLFTQSNLGVVTEGTVWLSPLPRHLAVVRFSIRDRAKLGPLMDAVRTLKLDGTLESGVGLWNDWRVLSVAEQYPWSEAGGVTPLPEVLLQQRAQAWGSASWLGLASIYAPSEEQGTAQRRHVERVLAPWVDELSFEARTGEPESGAELFPPDDPGWCFLQGIPHEQSLKSVYWRKREPAPDDPDPDRDRCGVIWLCPSVPLRAAEIEEAVNIVERVLPEHGFEPLLVIMAQACRTALLLPMIVFDRDTPGEDARAAACHDALMLRLVQQGHLPQRLGIQSMHALPPAQDDYDAVLRRLKQLLDPADVLSPGRYDFRGKGAP